MYGFLEKHLSPLAARILTGLWYGILLFAIYYAHFEPAAFFRYIEI